MSLSPPHHLVSAWKQALEWETFPDLLHISDCWFLLSGLRRWMTSEGFLTSFFLFSYLQSCTPRCYASQPAVLSRAGGGAFSSNQQGFLKPVKATDERVHASKCSGEHKLLLPSQSISHITPHSDLHTQEEWVWWRTNTHASMQGCTNAYTPNIRGRHAQTVETESFTEGGIRVFSQLGD